MGRDHARIGTLVFRVEHLRKVRRTRAGLGIRRTSETVSPARRRRQHRSNSQESSSTDSDHDIGVELLLDLLGCRGKKGGR